MSNVAQDIIMPEPHGKLFRIIFLYVGQGDSTLLMIPDSGSYKLMLIDCNRGEKTGGIDLARMLSDLGLPIDIFVNTHPHDDHLRGLKEICDESQIEILSVWHSGHTPAKPYSDTYKYFTSLMTKVGEDNVSCILGSREDKIIGDVSYNTLAPAEYVSDEIDGETPDTRKKRIHEQCAVIKFKYGEVERQIMITGDADFDGWQKYITNYHAERLPSLILSASHHGSRSFFKNEKEDLPFLDHLSLINPTYVIVSSPKATESQHGHPHEDAMDIYKAQTNKNSGEVFHLGENRESVVVDIFEDGNIEIKLDCSLVDEYGLENNNSGKGGLGPLTKTSFVGVGTRIDKKPMGKQ